MIKRYRRRSSPASTAAAAAGAEDGDAGDGSDTVDAVQWMGYNIADVRQLLGDDFGGIDLAEPNVIRLSGRGGAAKAGLLDWLVAAPDGHDAYAPDEFTAHYEPLDAGN
jgi:hypothetical protein